MSRSYRFAIAAAFSAIVVTACEMPQGDIKDPHTWGNYFLDKYATERADAMNLEAGHTPLVKPRTVLLITGVTIPAVWFDPIKARLERDGFHAVVYEPPQLLSGDLTQNSEALATVVDQIRAQTGEDRIDILAECTGGLIAREYVQALGGDAHVRRLVTFISPQHGLPKAPWAKSFVGWDALDDLTPGSDFLHEVNDAPLPVNVPITSIYSCTDEYIQPYATSNIPGAKNIELCDGFVGHFQFFYDPSIYDIMWKELNTPAPTDAVDPNAPAGPSGPSQPADPSSSTTSGSGGNGSVDPPSSPANAGAGCSSSGGNPGWLGMVGVAAMLGLGQRRRRRMA
jgi:MYXO-CTERM domain-containing protein